jgi:ABC-type multidrug transport system ATPase subunit
LAISLSYLTYPGPCPPPRRYVEQMDIHNEQATVREAVVFSARLRNAAAADRAYLAFFTQDLLEQMDLTFQAAQSVALTTPEQRKRITMGVEMAANPSVLFLDEPTSGVCSPTRAAGSLRSWLRVLGEGSSL